MPYIRFFQHAKEKNKEMKKNNNSLIASRLVMKMHTISNVSGTPSLELHSISVPQCVKTQTDSYLNPRQDQTFHITA